ncbi:MAG: hypothetical protein K2P67_03065, partial [Gallionellaceae bacterium]|nr:hypothetical protein [Gallionellaceae bacterium]
GAAGHRGAVMTRCAKATGAGITASHLRPQTAGYASNVSEADDIFCLAEPSGLGAPYFASSCYAACLPDPFHNDLGIRFSRPVEHLTQQRIAALLLEGIIFRVARILEDFHRDSAIESVYLSGGLSELACLQQGIAGCVPFDVYRLEQKDASLCGAAMLAAGMEPACHGAKEKIQPPPDTVSLQEKYRRWKDWLDGLLAEIPAP